LDATRIVEVLDWAADAGVSSDRIASSYHVWKWGFNDPESGDRSLEVSPYDEVASPLGWHSLPVEKDPRRTTQRFVAGTIINDTTTVGNNVFAHENFEGRSNWLNNYRPDGGKDLVFDYPYELQTKNGTWADPKSYIDLSITQLFYTCNMIHDVSPHRPAPNFPLTFAPAVPPLRFH
jgi:extracellular elastinolytic metalloproteinase